MILDQPIDVDAIRQLPEAERVKLVRQAFGEFARIVQTAQHTQTNILKQALTTVEQQHIIAILAEIKALPNK